MLPKSILIKNVVSELLEKIGQKLENPEKMRKFTVTQE